jgi:hypothetical protein
MKAVGVTLTIQIVTMKHDRLAFLAQRSGNRRTPPILSGLPLAAAWGDSNEIQCQRVNQLLSVSIRTIRLRMRETGIRLLWPAS